MKSEVILSTLARKKLYVKHHVTNQFQQEVTSSIMIDSGSPDHIQLSHQGNSSLLIHNNNNQRDFSQEVNEEKSPLISSSRSPSHSPDRVQMVPIEAEPMSLEVMKGSLTEMRPSFPSVITCGPGLCGNSPPLPNGTCGEMFPRTSYMGSVGLNLCTPSSMDSQIISPVSVPVMNDITQEHNMQCSPSPPSQNSESGSLSSPKQLSPQIMFDCHWLKCDQTFSNMDDLVSHVNDHHVKVERPDVDYQCKWDGCPRKGKGFNARYKMLIHIRTHTNEKPHSCKLCGKCFSRLENLKIHYRSHTGEKPYICPVEGCQKAYSNSSDRFKHVRTHQEEKPYICKMPGCNKRYTDPSSLRKHVRTHGHYYREENGKQKSSKVSSTMPQQQPIFPSVKLQIPSVSQSPTSPVNPLMSMSPNKLMPHSMPTHIHPLHNILHVSNFTSNPMLSSTILTPSSATHSTSTQTEGVIISLSPNSPLKMDNGGEKLGNEEDDKIQDGPLDLSTSPSAESDILVGHRESSTFSTGKWELINS
ncbi:zinc finger protein GLIS1-like [Mytilus edulis]|uniref:zinc finger protein GLIS1-like n=1 Tax=Mytilus edulis TaxID=6550 RepID=UPI0039F1455D